MPNRLYKIIATIIVAIILVGFLGPYLISSRSNNLVILGFVLLFGFIFYVGFQIWKYINEADGDGW